MAGEKQVVLLTGASGGIGRETAILLAQTGFTVYGAARQWDKVNELSQYGVIPLQLDVTKPYSCEQALQQILRQQGTLDVLINNAGYGSYGAVEDVPLQEAQAQLDVNVLGPVRLIQYVLPVFRRQHHGRIVMVSSIAGRVTGPYGGWYHASKYALEALSDALRMELKEMGIRVVLVEPGLVKTNWGMIAADHLENASKNGPNALSCAKVARGIRRLYQKKWLTSPKKVAQTIFLATRSARPQSRYFVGLDAYLIFWARALLPTELFDTLARWIMRRL